MLPRIRLGVAVVVSFWAFACGGASVPAPEETVVRYAKAAQNGDAEALRALLTADARERLGAEAADALVRQAKAELSRRGKALQKGPLVVEERAEVRYVDGETAHLTVEQGQFRVTSASGLPERPETPTEALASLRRALASRSYSQLSRVLTAETRAELESDLSSLVEGLEEPGALEIDVDGDRAQVVVPGGHKVWLRRKSGIWRVDDFE